MGTLGQSSCVLEPEIDLQALNMPPKRGKRPAEAAPVTLGSDSDQDEVLQWLRCTVGLPGQMVDKVRRR